MPTGYTADVGSGEVTDFAAFALCCARNFGALIHMRDERLDAPLTEPTPSDYNEKELARARERLARAQAMSPEDAEAAAEAEFARLRASWEKHHAEVVATRDRYRAMYEKALAWVPPSVAHAELKKFMLQQLSESIRFDCNDYPKPTRQTGAEWRREEIGATERLVAYHEKAHAEEIERVRGRAEWVAKLRESLSSVPS